MPLVDLANSELPQVTQAAQRLGRAQDSGRLHRPCRNEASRLERARHCREALQGVRQLRDAARTAADLSQPWAQPRDVGNRGCQHGTFRSTFILLLNLLHHRPAAVRQRRQAGVQPLGGNVAAQHDRGGRREAFSDARQRPLQVAAPLYAQLRGRTVQPWMKGEGPSRKARSGSALLA